jgi:hypothetical protein
MLLTERAVLERFINRLIEEEDANGSDELREQLKELVKDISFRHSVEDVASKVFDLYFEHAVELLERR